VNAVQTICPGCSAALLAPVGGRRPLRCPRCGAGVGVPASAGLGAEDRPKAGLQRAWKAGVVGVLALLVIGTTVAAGVTVLRRTPRNAAPVQEIDDSAAFVVFLGPSESMRSARSVGDWSDHSIFYSRVSADVKDEKKADKTPTFERDVAPLLKTYCVRCHGNAKAKGKVNLEKDKTDDAVRKNLKVWEKVGDNLRSDDMPPAGEKKPTAAEMEILNKWLDAVVYKADCTKPQDPGRVTIRRLNRAEYNNTIRDLVGIDFKPAKDFPSDDVGYGFDNVGDVLSLSPILMEKYLAAAEKIIDEAFKKPDVRKKLLPRQQAKDNKTATYDNFKDFATRAYRRPATDDEVKRLLRFVQLAREQGDSPEVGIKLALQAVLISPHFLFRIEKDPEKDDFIGQYELATRLSYFLWSSTPDDELFKLAKEGKLRDDKTLEAQIKRMLKDNKARALAENFGGQWLNVRSLSSFSPDPKKFPTWNASLRQAMLRETELFFHHVMTEDKSVLDFIDSDYTFVNAQLAKHYGLKDVKGEHFQKVSLKGTPRGGVLTQASVLAVTSNPTRTSPVKRGKWILENILGTPPPPPAPDAGELNEAAVKGGTLRQQMEAHRKNPACANCHARMDPLGFGFENFDAVGAWRDKDGKADVDPSGVLPDGATFKGPAELRKVLLKKKDLFVRCLADKLLTYATGRGTERSDRCFVEKIASQTAKNDYKFTSLVLEVVRSDAFQKRRAKPAQKK
jgi:cytochrome c553